MKHNTKLGIGMAALMAIASANAASLSSADYISLIKPNISAWTPTEGIAVNPAGFNAFAEGSITSASAYTARVYFGAENAGYRNTLGYTTDGSGKSSPSGTTIFANINSPPLVNGQFVDLGAFSASQKLDFYLTALELKNGQFVWRGEYSTQASANSDGKPDHTIQIRKIAGTQGNTFYVFGFEDLSLGDKDFNDLVFTVEVAPSVPEAGIGLASIAALGFACILGLRRKDRV